MGSDGPRTASGVQDFPKSKALKGLDALGATSADMTMCMVFFTWGQMSRVRRWSRITVDFFIQHPVIARGAFIRFDQSHVLGAIHSRVCDMLLNARSSFSC